jgi:hypothetical protein
MENEIVEMSTARVDCAYVHDEVTVSFYTESWERWTCVYSWALKLRNGSAILQDWIGLSMGTHT